MTDDIFPGLRTGANEHEQKHDVEQQDAASLQRELNEQERIGNAQRSPFDHNRVPVERKPG